MIRYFEDWTFVVQHCLMATANFTQLNLTDFTNKYLMFTF